MERVFSLLYRFPCLGRAFPRLRLQFLKFGLRPYGQRRQRQDRRKEHNPALPRNAVHQILRFGEEETQTTTYANRAMRRVTFDMPRKRQRQNRRYALNPTIRTKSRGGAPRCAPTSYGYAQVPPAGEADCRGRRLSWFVPNGMFTENRWCDHYDTKFGINVKPGAHFSFRRRAVS